METLETRPGGVDGPSLKSLYKIGREKTVDVNVSFDLRVYHSYWDSRMSMTYRSVIVVFQTTLKTEDLNLYFCLLYVVPRTCYHDTRQSHPTLVLNGSLMVPYGKEDGVQYL